MKLGQVQWWSVSFAEFDANEQKQLFELIFIYGSRALEAHRKVRRLHLALDVEKFTTFS